MSKRTCGTCVACCIYYKINDGVIKDALTACSFLCSKPEEPSKRESDNMPLLEKKHYQLKSENNCTIHEKRPGTCANYFCEWLKGEGLENDRPDKSGVIFDNIAPNGLVENAIIAKPLWLGAEDETAGIEAINNVSRSSDKPVLVSQFTERKLLKVVGRGIN